MRHHAVVRIPHHHLKRTRVIIATIRVGADEKRKVVLIGPDERSHVNAFVLRSVLLDLLARKILEGIADELTPHSVPRPANDKDKLPGPPARPSCRATPKWRPRPASAVG